MSAHTFIVLRDGIASQRDRLDDLAYALPRGSKGCV
jgi:hypothetical protein